MVWRRRSPRPKARSILDLPAKANRVLNVILIMLLCIVLRVWHLSVVQFEEKTQEAKKPQQRTILEPANRGTIHDRYGTPLAINKIQYNAAVIYSPLRQIPTSRWVDESGKRVKKFPRKDYISSLSKLLGKELSLDQERIEDLIYSKASFFAHVPFVLKENISEKEYYRLRMLEKDWVGIQVQILPRRSYPKGKLASDIIGFLGAIDQRQYQNIVSEMKTLETYLQEKENGEDPPLPAGIDSPGHAFARWKDLQEKAYSINDLVGKAGIEGRFEEQMRGFHGKKIFYTDAKGNFLRQLPGSREPLAGQKLILTISAELQEYAEKLLAQNERIRKGVVSGVDSAKQAILSVKQPWIKGGAILAIDPKNGEVLAMASYPRTNPNDFIPGEDADKIKQKRANIQRWFETESHIADIWDQRAPLERERYDDANGIFFEEKKLLDWDAWLDMILAPHSAIKPALQSVSVIGQAAELQKCMEEIQMLCGQPDAYAVMNFLYSDEGDIAHAGNLAVVDKACLEDAILQHQKRISPLKRKLDPILKQLPYNYDKVMLLDICRVCVDAGKFDNALLRKVGSQSLSEYRNACASCANVLQAMKGMAKEIFHSHIFKQWRIDNEKIWLKQKRAEEKANKQYPRPYIDYFDALENTMFQTFWQENRYRLALAFLRGIEPEHAPEEYRPFFEHFIHVGQEWNRGAHAHADWSLHYAILKKAVSKLEEPAALQYLESLRSFQELDRPLLGKYRRLRQFQGVQTEKSLAAGFYPLYGFGYGRSQAYRQSATQGSLFKLVTAYAALVQRYQELPPKQRTLPNLNPLVIEDRIFRNGKELCVGCKEDGTPIPRMYKGGRLIKSTHSLGKVDLMKAIETSSNPYFSLLAGDYLKSPDALLDAAKQFSYGSKTGIDLPGEIPGRLPDDLKNNRTGLYATAIGQHSLVVTPLQSCIMLSALANGGRIMKPKIVRMKSGRVPQRGDEVFHCSPEFPLKECLNLVGIDFPLFAALRKNDGCTEAAKIPTVVKREIFFPPLVRKYQLQAMERVVQHTQEKSLISLSRFYQDYPEAISDYLDLKDDMVGKTSTAEQEEIIGLDLEEGKNMYTHVWFGGISFSHADNKSAVAQSKDRFNHPELVVVVYLKYGNYGKEAAPLAAQIIQKWREIKLKNSRK